MFLLHASLHGFLICTCCRTEREAKVGKNKTRHRLKKRHRSFTHSLDKCRKSDSVEQWKLAKQKRNRKFGHKTCN